MKPTIVKVFKNILINCEPHSNLLHIKENKSCSNFTRESVKVNNADYIKAEVDYVNELKPKY